MPTNNHYCWLPGFSFVFLTTTRILVRNTLFHRRQHFKTSPTSCHDHDTRRWLGRQRAVMYETPTWRLRTKWPACHSFPLLPRQSGYHTGCVGSARTMGTRPPPQGTAERQERRNGAPRGDRKAKPPTHPEPSLVKDTTLCVCSHCTRLLVTAHTPTITPTPGQIPN